MSSPLSRPVRCLRGLGRAADLWGPALCTYPGAGPVGLDLALRQELAQVLTTSTLPPCTSIEGCSELTVGGWSQRCSRRPTSDAEPGVSKGRLSPDRGVSTWMRMAPPQQQGSCCGPAVLRSAHETILALRSPQQLRCRGPAYLCAQRPARRLCQDCRYNFYSCAHCSPMRTGANEPGTQRASSQRVWFRRRTCELRPARHQETLVRTSRRRLQSAS